MSVLPSLPELLQVLNVRNTWQHSTTVGSVCLNLFFLEQPDTPVPKFYAGLVIKHFAFPSSKIIKWAL